MSLQRTARGAEKFGSGIELVRRVLLGWTERRFVLLVACTIWVITYLPYFVNRIMTPPQKIFTESLMYQSDFNIYYSFIRQAAACRWLFENQLTPEKHRPVFFNLQWLILGKMQRFLPLSTEALFQLWRALSGTVLLLAFGLVSSMFLKNSPARKIALISFGTGGGFGWLVLLLEYLGITDLAGRWELGGAGPADTFGAIHPFVQIFRSPFHAFATGLAVFTIGLFLLGERRDAPAYRWGVGVSCLALGMVRPHEMLIVITTLALYTVMRWRADDGFSRKTLTRLANVCMSLPIFLYYIYLLKFHPIFKWAHAQNTLPPLFPLNLMLSVGFVGLFALANVGWMVKHLAKDPAYALLASWILATLALFYTYPFLPYSVEFGTALIPPLVILAVARSAHKLARLERRTTLIVVLFLMFNGLTSVWMLYTKSQEWRLAHSAAFLDRQLVAAFEWLEQHSQPSDLVFASPEVGEWIPRYAGNKVFSADRVPTLHFTAKVAMVRTFYSETTSEAWRTEILRRFDVRYVLQSPYERSLGAFDPTTMSALVLVFANDAVAIYEVR